MPYQIQCRTCQAATWADNVVTLLDDHTGPTGRFNCANCNGTDRYIYKSSELQEEGEVWKRWIKGVIRIHSGIPTYSPYIFLTADTEDGDINGLHVHYYKDTRPAGGRLKHGHGPGGPPVLGLNDLFTIIKHLVDAGILSKEAVEDFAAKL